MNRDIFMSFLETNFQQSYPVYTYLKHPLNQINSKVSSEGAYPIISNKIKFIWGERTGYWHCFPFGDSTHAKEKEKRKNQDFWIEGENHVYKEFRHIYLRNGGSYDMLLFILARDVKLLQEYWDLGVAIKSQRHGVQLGEYYFDVFPTIGDLFLLSLSQPDLFPELKIQWEGPEELKKIIRQMLSQKVTAIDIKPKSA